MNGNERVKVKIFYLQLMYLPDFVVFVATILCTFAAQTNTEQQLKPKQSKKIWAQKKFATNTTNYIVEFTTGLAFLSTSLAELQRKNKRKFLSRFFGNWKNPTIWVKIQWINYFARNATDFWPTDSWKEFVHFAILKMRVEINVTIVENWSMPMNWKVPDVNCVRERLKSRLPSISLSICRKLKVDWWLG